MTKTLSGTGKRPVRKTIQPLPIQVASASDVRAAIERLRKFHEVGRQSIEQYPGYIRYGSSIHEAKKCGLHPEMLRKARAFAREYSPHELDALCALAERERFPVGVVYAVRLVTVKKGRSAFQRQAIKGHWSNKRLDAEIRRRYGKRKNTGRKRRRPTDRFDAAYQVVRFCEEWQRLANALRDDSSGAVSFWAQWPAAVQKQLGRADEVMDSLGKLLSRQLPMAVADGEQ